MIFTACHPVLSPAARVALTLRLVGGLTVEEIAQAYVVPAAAIAQRIVRAKRTIADKRIPYAVPEGPELARRLDSVLEVICLISDLAVVLLHDQDRSRWDRLLIRRGYLALQRAHELNARHGRPPGRFALQAAIAAEHAIARTPGDTNWPRLARLYAILAARFPSPVVQLNRVVAVGMAAGPAAGLALADELAATGALDGYHLLHAVRADLLTRLGRFDEAEAAFRRAAARTANTAEQRLLQDRAADAALRSGR